MSVELSTPEREAIYPLLVAAAEAFFAHGEPDFDTSTTGNRFVHLAERAFYNERDRAEAARTRPDPPGGSTTQFYLYRLFDQAHRLLYIGITANPNARLKRHQRRFGPLLDHWTFDSYTSRAAVLSAEAEAIAREDPAFNTQHPSTD